MIRNISQRLATQLLEAGAQHMPNQSIITAIIRVAWASAAGNLGLATGSPAELHDPFKTNNQKISAKEDDIALACEAIEVLAFAIALHPQVVIYIQQINIAVSKLLGLHIYFDINICPPLRHPSVLSCYSCHKISKIKVA